MYIILYNLDLFFIEFSEMLTLLHYQSAALTQHQRVQTTLYEWKTTGYPESTKSRIASVLTPRIQFAGRTGGLSPIHVMPHARMNPSPISDYLMGPFVYVAAAFCATIQCSLTLFNFI